MTIQAGERLPDATFTIMSESGPAPLTRAELFGGKKVVLFSVPGAFTPTCSARHLPGYVDLADEILGKGVDTIACMAVNDVFVMNAWGKSANADRRQRRFLKSDRAGTGRLGLRHGRALPTIRTGRRRRPGNPAFY